MPERSTFSPQNTAQIADVVSWAVSQAKPLEVMGHGSKRDVGRASQYAASLDTAGLVGITLYEPEELVLSARAGTPLADILKALGEQGQELAFEPPDLSVALGGAPDPGTIGGAIASNFAGPRRIKAGAARDHFLGVTAVSGRGEIFKSGGRVVKNVTGYDLCKVLAGSWGTLAVIADVTVKVLPAAETQASVLLSDLEPSAAVRAMCAAMQGICEVSGAAHMPVEAAKRSGVAAVGGAGAAVTALRVEGIEASVRYRCAMLVEQMSAHGAVAVLGDEASRALWRELRDVALLEVRPDRVLWRLSVPPASGAGVHAHISERRDARALFDWSGGLVWIDTGADGDGGAALMRAAIAPCGGHATLIRAGDALRATVPVFQPASAGLEALSRRLKQGFDPSGILNPGRMQA
jgi:glycolate oxidase FAD binding subunit